MRDLRKALQVADQRLAAQAQRSDGVRDQVMERILHVQQRPGWSNGAMLLAALAGAALALLVLKLWPQPHPIPVAEPVVPHELAPRAGGMTPRVAASQQGGATPRAPRRPLPSPDFPPDFESKRDRSDDSSPPPFPSSRFPVPPPFPSVPFPGPAPSSASQDDEHRDLRSDDPEQNGTLVAIAIGGRCAFTVDGEPIKRASSIRLKVRVGEHLVGCFSKDGAKHQRVEVAHTKPGIASFRVEPDDLMLTPRGPLDHGF